MDRKTPLTAEALKETLRYEPETGDFYWKHRPQKHFVNDSAYKSWNTQWENKKAGTMTKSGYLDIHIYRKNYRAHRLAWLYEYGEFPEMGLDHINQIKNDNRISNLRLATNNQNIRNVSKTKRNTSGYKGVSFTKAKNKWRAAIAVNKKTIFLGYFKTPKEAHDAYCRAALEHHGEFAQTE